MAVKFREKAKETLSSAEKLDLPVRHVPPHWWIAVGGGLFSAAAFVLWAFLGRIPMTAEGTAVYMKSRGEVICFVQIEGRSGIEEGMKVRFQEEGAADPALDGYLVSEEDFWTSNDEMLEYVNGDETLLKYLTDGNPVAVYRCTLEGSAENRLEDGTVFRAEIQKESVHPVELWL